MKKKSTSDAPKVGEKRSDIGTKSPCDEQKKQKAVAVATNAQTSYTSFYSLVDYDISSDEEEAKSRNVSNNSSP